jgi:glycosyltransferase involved in cell wall biosynthesis
MAETLVFVPAWNEERNLPPVLEELRRELPEADVVVVDHGSTDATARVAREHGADVVSFGENRGLRAAIAAGYGAAAERGYKWCGRVDADGQHPATELRRLLERVRAGSCDVASALASSRETATRSSATARAPTARSAPRSCGA